MDNDDDVSKLAEFQAAGAEPEDADALLAEMNQKYCVVQDGGSVDVLAFDRHVCANEHVRHTPIFLSFTDFRNQHCHKTILVRQTKDGMEMQVPVRVGHWWLKNGARRQYDGLTFDPRNGNVVNGKLNLWRGWGIKPEEGDWSLMATHIKTVLAADDEVCADYIFKWLAWCVQNPDRRAEVAIVFKGKRGTGKGTLGNAMVRMFGQHGVQISDPKYLTGFNAHLRDACFLFGDECYWPGDKSAEGNFKRLITEPTLFIEAKGRDPVSVQNMLHVMLASNEDWIVPGGERERRFAVFNVSECYIQNPAWFKPLYEQLENGGYAAMLHDLLDYELGDWHPRQLPHTPGLLDQQRQSLAPLDAWWVELLEGGTIEGANPRAPDCAVSKEYQRKVEGDEGHERYIRQPGIYDQARGMEPRLRRNASDHAIGHYLRDRGCISKKVLQRRGWEFPPLSAARKAWEARYPGWCWRDPEATDWNSEGG